MRRSTRRGAQKEPGFYAKMHAGKFQADFTACHMRAKECSRLYGEDVTKDAGTKEVLNMIRDRKAATPVDYRNLSQEILRDAVTSFMFFKAKDLPPGEQTIDRTHVSPHDKDQTGATSWSVVRSKREKRKGRNQINLRGRWVGGGHEQERDEVLAERVAPTARGTTYSILLWGSRLLRDGNS